MTIRCSTSQEPVRTKADRPDPIVVGDTAGLVLGVVEGSILYPIDKRIYGEFDTITYGCFDSCRTFTVYYGEVIWID